ncbi:GTP pyrophosphokinase [Rhodococcus gannanensis]|uniref:GTP pyrophosphokinase family protein n=1 Tax=Rhodococcus gannanensis TaxID=1960308 RepID=A0ABW4NYX1_9NOCA
MTTHPPASATEPELVILGDLFRDLTGTDPATPSEAPTLDALRELQQRLVAFRLNYKFAIDMALTKINILREEFEQSHDYSPIEHVNTRLKSMESLVQKALRIGCPPDIDSIREQIRDIAGLRVTCAFVSDAYWVAEMLTSQPDVTLVQVKDYIANPKPNGYQSLHLIVQVPVYLSDRTESTYVEIQIRTIAMDFWASLEHKIYYKFDRAVPPRLLDELKQAADAATELDRTMARLHDEVTALDRGATTLD